MTYTRLLRSRGNDHPETQMAIGRALHGLAAEMGFDPHGEEWLTSVLPFVVGVFNLGRAVAYRSLVRALLGMPDPDTFPEHRIEVQIDPDGGFELREVKGAEIWTPPN